MKFFFIFSMFFIICKISLYSQDFDDEDIPHLKELERFIKNYEIKLKRDGKIYNADEEKEDIDIKEYKRKILREINKAKVYLSNYIKNKYENIIDNYAVPSIRRKLLVNILEKRLNLFYKVKLYKEAKEVLEKLSRLCKSQDFKYKLSEIFIEYAYVNSVLKRKYYLDKSLVNKAYKYSKKNEYKIKNWIENYEKKLEETLNDINSSKILILNNYIKTKENFKVKKLWSNIIYKYLSNKDYIYALGILNFLRKSNFFENNKDKKWVIFKLYDVYKSLNDYDKALTLLKKYYNDLKNDDKYLLCIKNALINKIKELYDFRYDICRKNTTKCKEYKKEIDVLIKKFISYFPKKENPFIKKVKVFLKRK